MDREQIQLRLMALRDEARALADARSVTVEQVEDWRKRTLAALNDCCGPRSREFAEIKFDDSRIVDVAERVLRQAPVDVSDLRIRLPANEKALRRGLYEAAELLTSLIG